MPVQLECKHYAPLQVEDGTTLEQLLGQLDPPLYPRPLAALVNGQRQELSYPLFTDSKIEFLDYHCPEGWRIYQRSLVFIMRASSRELFPERELWVSHSQNDGYFCWLDHADGTPVDIQELHQLEQRMREHVAAKTPIVRTELSRTDIISYFRSNGQEGKARLMERRNEKYISLYHMGEFTDYCFGRMAPSADYINEFSLLPCQSGFVLRLPLRSFIGQQSIEVQPRQLQTILAESAEWSELMGVRTVDDLNCICESGRQAFLDLTLSAETLQERQLHRVSDEIFSCFPQVRLVLLAGPSSTGKTTTTRRLAIQFRTLGIRPVVISLDDYFYDRDKTPLREDGHPDFENLVALDVQRFNRDMLDLLAGKETVLPRYDFISGKSIPEDRRLRLADNEILLVEGIHALNEQLSATIPHKNKRRIFASPMNQINLDAGTPIASSDNRLLRRIVRDRQFRGHSAEATLENWNEVRYGEHRNIFPWQRNADFFINTSLIYELPVLRPFAEEALCEVAEDSPVYHDAQRMLRIIRYVEPADSSLVPTTSILREFIGGGLFND